MSKQTPTSRADPYKQKLSEQHRRARGGVHEEEPEIRLLETRPDSLRTISTNLSAMRGRFTEILTGQNEEIEQRHRVLLEAVAHRKTAQSLADMLGQISDDKAFHREADALQRAVGEIDKMKNQPAAQPTERDILLESSPEFQKALEMIEFHHEACAGVVLTPEQLNFLKAAIIHPTVCMVLSKGEGDARVVPNADVVTIYTNRILELIRSPGLLSMITKTMSFNSDGAEQAVVAAAAGGGNVEDLRVLDDAGAYQTSVGELNNLCRIACEAIRDNDEILLQLIESIASLYNFDTVKGILKTIAGVASVTHLAPAVVSPLKVLFEMGIEATGLVVSFALTDPVLYILLCSHIIVNIEQYYSLLADNALKVKQFALGLIPASAIANPPATGAAAALGGAPAPGVEQSKLVFGLLKTGAHKNFFKLDTAIGQLEGCIFKLVEVCTASVHQAVDLFKEAAAFQVGQTVLGKIPKCIQVIVDRIFEIRNTRCAVNGGKAVTATYKMRSAFLRSLQTGLDTGLFPSFNRAVRLIIHLSSVRYCALTIGLVSLHTAFDLVVKGPSTFARGALTDSQLANAGSPSLERNERTESEIDRAFFASNGFGGVLNEGEPRSDGPSVEPEYLPQHNPRDFANWLLLAKLLATQDAAARGANPPKQRWTNPIMRMIQAISAVNTSDEQVRTIQEMVDDPATPDGIKIAYSAFIAYITEQNAAAAARRAAAAAARRAEAAAPEVVPASEEVVVNLDDSALLDAAIITAKHAGEHCIVPVCNKVTSTSVDPSDSTRAAVLNPQPSFAHFTAADADDPTATGMGNLQQGVEVSAPVQTATTAAATFPTMPSAFDRADLAAGNMNNPEGGKSRTHRRRPATAKRTRRKAYNKKSNKRKSRKQLSRKRQSRRRQSRRK